MVFIQQRLQFVAMPKPDRTRVTEGQAILIKQIHQFHPDIKTVQKIVSISCFELKWQTSQNPTNP